MIKIIKTHNYLNGSWFSFLEYLLVACIVIPFFAYYMTHGIDWYALVALGIILNCLTMAGIALVSIINKEPSVHGWRFYRDKDFRQEITRQYPDLSKQTAILSVGILIPFLIALAVVRDWVRVSGRRG